MFIRSVSMAGMEQENNDMTTLQRQRMTAVSRANLRLADRVQFIDLGEGETGIKAWRGESAAVVCTGEGPARYPSETAARRAMRRIRPDLEPSTL